MDKRAKIVMVIPCWKRCDILSITVNQLDIFYNATKSKIDFTVVYVFSLNDPELDKHIKIYRAANHCRDYIYSENERLGKKLNDGILYANKFKYDYIMNFGSDDLLHPYIIDLYMPYIERKEPLFGLNSLWFHEFGKAPFFFSYYNEKHIVGAGRMIHRNVIQIVKNRYRFLYDNDIARGMDTMSAHRMQACGFKQTTIEPGKFPFLVDIKSDVNINNYQSVKSAIKIKTKTPDNELFNVFPILKANG